MARFVQEQDSKDTADTEDTEDTELLLRPQKTSYNPLSLPHTTLFPHLPRQAPTQLTLASTGNLTQENQVR